MHSSNIAGKWLAKSPLPGCRRKPLDNQCCCTAFELEFSAHSPTHSIGIVLGARRPTPMVCNSARFEPFWGMWLRIRKRASLLSLLCFASTEGRGNPPAPLFSRHHPRSLASSSSAQSRMHEQPSHPLCAAAPWFLSCWVRGWVSEKRACFHALSISRFLSFCWVWSSVVVGATNTA